MTKEITKIDLNSRMKKSYKYNNEEEENLYDYPNHNSKYL